MGDKEVHGNVLTVDVLVHHISDGLGHHVRIQVGIILSGMERQSHALLEATLLLAFIKNVHGPGGWSEGGGVGGEPSLAFRELGPGMLNILQGRSFPVNS